VPIDTSKGHQAMDYREHEKSYALFMKGTLWGTVIVVAVLVGMAFFLV
jgi:hypothetical protein